jgi:uncharacterized membrane protein YsdA (DUF1294 family)
LKDVIVYLFIINIITFLLYGSDKKRARWDRRRIPEKVLLGLAAVGGSVGAWMGMKVYRHKIRKWKFIIGVPLILILQILAVSYYSFVH